MIEWLPLMLFLVIQALGIAVIVSLILDRNVPFPRNDPRGVFQLVRREDRAAYARIMRRTYAVQWRDFGRAVHRFQRDVAKQLIPIVRRLNDTLSDAFGKPER